MATEESSRSTTSKDKRSEISRGEPRLPKKVRDAMRETDQYSCIKAILERDTFTTACVILQYSGQETATEEQIAFAAKGLLRSALHDHPEGLKLIRLFGTQKHHWVRRKDKLSARYDASTADLFTSWKAIGSGKELREGEIDLPLGWRSRILFRTFPDAESLNRALSCCPLAQWGPPAQGNEPRHCGLLDSLSGYEGNSAPIMWLQFHDVEWEAGKRLSECVVECVQGPDLYDFKLLASHSCPTHASLSTAEAHRNNLPSFPLRIAWRIENDSPLHSRCSREFARTFDPEFAKELAKDSHLKYSHHLRLRRSPGDFGPDQPSPPPSFLVSSVRGVLRSAMAWLFESLVRDGRLGPPSVTSDYSDKDWAARRQAGEICPVQLLLGGVRQDGQGGFRSTIRLFAKRKSPADDIHGSFIS